MSLALALVLAVALERLVELVIARRHSQALLAEGGVEHGAWQVTAFILLHGAWLAALAAVAWQGAALQWTFVVLYGLLLVARIWTMASLGRFWTVRVITLPAAPLVKRGPYRWLRHPNYLVVIGEVAILPLALGTWRLALLFSILNLALVAARIRVEDAALAPRRG
ncbi:MAG TPA: isoprenylcysteine carboxylmethyltransferase family protein [Alphaproteobacteria bacterium]|nr:isoprenylcysteine carboxylmethyltransferase family protein [Alphaproteobacteria bacterium]